MLRIVTYVGKSGLLPFRPALPKEPGRVVLSQPEHAIIMIMIEAVLSGCFPPRRVVMKWHWFATFILAHSAHQVSSFATPSANTWLFCGYFDDIFYMHAKFV